MIAISKRACSTMKIEVHFRSRPNLYQPFAFTFNKLISCGLGLKRLSRNRRGGLDKSDPSDVRAGHVS
jgi:hypothetical protein